jgi:cytochrome c
MRRLLPLALCAAAAVAACKPTEPLTDAEQTAAIKGLPAPYNTANIANGKSIFQQCRSCHTIAADGANMTGPNLYNVWGRTAGTKENYNYSDPVKGLGFAWDADKLNQWLEGPRSFVPGTKMTFVGLPNQQDRIDVIGYLRTQSDKKPAGT